MPELRPIKSSFTSGEVAPSLWGRPDLQKYSTGARTLENFSVLQYGGITKRPGTKFSRLLSDDDFTGGTVPVTTNFLLRVNFTIPDGGYLPGVVLGTLDTGALNADLIEVGNRITFMGRTYTITIISTLGGRLYLTFDPMMSYAVVASGNPIPSGDDDNPYQFDIYVDITSNRYDADATHATRLIPFQFSLTDSYMLLFTHKNVSFFRDGEPVLNSAGEIYRVDSPYSAEHLESLSYAQSADVLYMVHPDLPPYEFFRVSHNDWRWALFAFESGPFAARTINDGEISLTLAGIGAEDEDEAGTSVTTKGDKITVTADGELFDETHIGSLWSVIQTVDSAKAVTTGQVVSGTRTVGIRGYRSTGHSVWYQVWAMRYISGEDRQSIFAVGNKFVLDSITYTITSRSTFTQSGSEAFSMYISPVAPWAAFYPPEYDVSVGFVMPTNDDWGAEMMVCDTYHVVTNGFWYGEIAIEEWSEDENRWIRIRTLSSTNSANGAKNYDIEGTVNEPTRVRIVAVTNFTTFVPSGNTENDRGFVELWRPSSLHRGIFRVDEIISPTEIIATVIVPFVSDNASISWQQGAWSAYEGYPRSVVFFEERLIFAGTHREPQTIWFSKSGNYYDFGTSIPVVDNDAITRTMASRQMNIIEALVPINALIALTGSSEWKITGGTYSALTPTNFLARVQGARGCGRLDPIIINATVLFADAKHSKINDLIYSYDTDLYQGTDVTILAPHIFEEHRATDWAFQNHPHGMVWVVRSDGVLVSLTYLREQEVIAWARHPMPESTVKSVGCISSSITDVVYLVIKRGNRYTVETLTAEETTAPEDSYFVDGGIQIVSATPVRSVTGLEHLNGYEVVALLDGDVMEHPATVSNGQITLPYMASKISVGLPYTSYAETLDLGFDRKTGTQATGRARIPQLAVRVQNTRGLFLANVTLDETYLTTEYEEVKDRHYEGQGSPIALFTGDIDASVATNYNGGRLSIKAPHPLPAKILMIVPRVEVVQ